jgi:uncharacterized membrane protein
MANDVLVVFFRWLHVITACAVIGCAFFMRVIVPIGLRGLEPSVAEAAFLRARRGFKFVVHPGILLFLISGIYNAIAAWPDYSHWAHPGLTHGLFGLHILLALIAWTILLYALAGREPKRGSQALTKLNLVVLALTVAAASTLKIVHGYAHDHRVVQTSSHR